MHAFDYLSVLLSIVLGLGMTQLLSAVARWLELRHEVKPYLPAAIWAAFLMIVLVQTWWAMFGMRNIPDWSFLQFCVVLAQPVLLFLLTALVLPGPQSQERDLEAFFIQHRTWFFGLLMALLVVSVSKDLALSGHLPATPNLIFHGVFFAGSVLALVSRRPAFQLLIALIALILMGAYIAVLFADLAQPGA
ncbi:hypothetical protein [Phenylobacterium sp.]|uniref:hypothetical protein n=1 Tax=Phenylobacterium sp. TaxID=1871053 RepID=UPI00356929E4